MASSNNPDTGLIPQIAANPLGETLRRLRIATNISQNDLAQKIGVSRITIARMERGDNTSIYILQRYLQALNVELQLVAPDYLNLSDKLIEASTAIGSFNSKIILPIAPH